MKKAFYAYPSQYPSIVYSIQNAIHLINNSGFEIRARDWQTLSSGGKFILDEVCGEIDDSDVFLCDLTYINANVLFELGYAIANNKRIWISINKDLHDKEKLYEELGLLTTIGYCGYHNERDLSGYFLNEQPYNDISNTLFNKKMRSSKRFSKSPKVLYLKAAKNTRESSELTRLLLKSGVPLVTDDPLETHSRPLEEYIDILSSSFGLIAHFSSGDQDARSAKYSLICGIGYGLSIKPLMLAHAPYKPAIDYRDLMFVHQNPKQCLDHVDVWLIEIKDQFGKYKKRFDEFQKKQSALEALNRINLGEYEAEGEKEQLSKYFLRTAAFNAALQTTNYMIFVGRKGSGKTANFYQIAQELVQNSSLATQVCLIKPVHYDIEGVFQLFNLVFGRAEKGHLIESLWKYLIYTELALDSYKTIISKPQAMLSPIEVQFVNYVSCHEFLLADFTVRMEHAIKDLCQIDLSNSIVEHRQKVSEILHNQVISQLRIMLGNILSDKEKVFILIDNLDKAWQKRDELSTLSEFLFGLLKIGERISVEFHQSDSRKKKVDLVILVFIRGDIFSYIPPNARERDKLKSIPIIWNNPQILLRVIEERFRNSLNGIETSEEIWSNYFPEDIDGVPVKEFIIDHILPRPRDIIFLCKQALYHAINHGHSRIEKEDLLLAVQDYSYHGWVTLLAETETQFPGIDKFLDLLTKESAILSRVEIESFIEEAGISKRKFDEIVDLLCEAGFLGLECDLNQFVFIYDDRLKQRRIQARKVSKQTNQERFKINTPFHSYLELKA